MSNILLTSPLNTRKAIQTRISKYSGGDYLKIDIANQFGLNRELFKTRISWVNKNISKLEEFTKTAKDRMMYIKAVKVLRRVQRGEATGYIMGLDATASGPQMLALLSGCRKTAIAVNLIFSGKREDIYDRTAKNMNIKGIYRKDIKIPVMVTFYGSIQEPKLIFGDGTYEYNKFMHTLYTELPGAMMCMQSMQSMWNPRKLVNTWKLPDDHISYVRVKDKVSKVIEIDELNHATFTHRCDVYAPVDYALNLPANITHSGDALIVREMTRRCNYNVLSVAGAKERITLELLKRNDKDSLDLYGRMVCFNHVIEVTPYIETTAVLREMLRLIELVQVSEPFEIVMIHDEFKASPNNMGMVSEHYRQITAQIAESTMLQDILRELSGNKTAVFDKMSKGLGEDVLESVYALS